MPTPLAVLLSLAACVPAALCFSVPLGDGLYRPTSSSLHLRCTAPILSRVGRRSCFSERSSTPALRLAGGAGATMAADTLDTFLIEGDCSDFQEVFKQEVKTQVSDIKFLTIYHCYLENADLDRIQQAIKEMGLRCPVYYSKSYGILGFNPKTGKNMELMGKEVGTEYGCRGGDGGKGCTTVAYSGSNFRAFHIPEGSSMKESKAKVEEAMAGADSVLVVTDGTEKADVDAFVLARGPPCYGGVAKPSEHAVGPHTQNFVVDGEGNREEVRHFFISHAKSDSEAVATLSFTGEAAEAGQALMSELPSGLKPSGAVGLFPCFTRGVNTYDAFNVEPEALGKVIQGTRIYGMFAHGEIGPPEGKVCVGGDIESAKHSETSILAVHVAKSP